MARFEVSPVEINEIASISEADALYDLGLKYCSGRGVEIDLVEAHKWFNVAAQRGHQEARRQRAELAAEMSREEIAAAQRAARAWLGRH